MDSKYSSSYNTSSVSYSSTYYDTDTNSHGTKTVNSNNVIPKDKKKCCSFKLLRIMCPLICWTISMLIIGLSLALAGCDTDAIDKGYPRAFFCSIRKITPLIVLSYNDHNYDCNACVTGSCPVRNIVANATDTRYYYYYHHCQSIDTSCCATKITFDKCTLDYKTSYYVTAWNDIDSFKKAHHVNSTINVMDNSCDIDSGPTAKGLLYTGITFIFLAILCFIIGIVCIICCCYH